MSRSALARTESRGMHWREDHPQQDARQRHYVTAGGLDEVWTAARPHGEGALVEAAERSRSSIPSALHRLQHLRPVRPTSSTDRWPSRHRPPGRLPDLRPVRARSPRGRAIRLALRRPARRHPPHRRPPERHPRQLPACCGVDGGDGATARGGSKLSAVRGVRGGGGLLARRLTHLTASQPPSFRGRAAGLEPGISSLSCVHFLPVGPVTELK